MPEQNVRIIRVFVSSPGDVADERAVLSEVVDTINRTDGQAGVFRLELFRWEDDVVPQVGPKPQQVVDAQTTAYDIYLGIMSTRFGTPTGRCGSGTEKEYKEASKDWKAAGAPWITFYFNDQPTLSSNPDDVKQYLKVCEFREKMQKQGLYASYKGVRGSAESFYEKVSLHLRKITRLLLTRHQHQNGEDCVCSGSEVPPLLRDLERELASDDFDGFPLAPIVRNALLQQPQLELVSDHNPALIAIAIRESVYNRVSAEAGDRDWQSDFAVIAMPILVAVSKSLNRSAEAQTLIVRLCERLAEALHLRVDWPKDALESNERKNALYRECLKATGVESDDVVSQLKGLTLIGPE